MTELTAKKFAEAKPFRTISAAELLNLPTPDALIAHVIEQHSLSLLYGAPASGKSFIGLDLALHVAYGRPWCGRETRAGSVLYVAAEGHSVLSRRLRAWLDYYRLEPPSNIHFVLDAVNLMEGERSLEKFMLDCLGSISTFETVLDDDAPDRPIIDIVELPPLQLIIFDTLSRCIPGADENDAKDMSKVVQWLDLLRDKQVTGGHQPAIIVVHHTSKSSEIERGSSVMRAAVDTMLHVRKTKAGIIVSCRKQRSEEEFGEIRFLIEQNEQKEALVIPHGDYVALQLKSKSQLEIDTLARQAARPPLPTPLTPRHIDLLIELIEGPLNLRELSIAMKTSMSNLYPMKNRLSMLGYVFWDTDEKTCCLTREGALRLVNEGKLGKDLVQ